MEGIFIGYDKHGKPLAYKKDGPSNGEGHLFLSAPPRSGKARDILIPALLQYDQGSCIVIDPKGQLAAVTAAQRRRMGQRVVVLNPFNIWEKEIGQSSARFDPLAALDPASPTFGADCDNIADSIVTHEGGDRENHWSDSAHGLVSGLIGHLAGKKDPKSKTLAMLRRVITSPALLRKFAEDAQTGDDELVAESLARYAEKDADNKGELTSIISTANTQTKFLANRAISDSLSGSDFKFRDLKTQPTTVYLVLPVKYLKSCGKWFRLVLASALDELLTEDTDDESGLPVLCILDEFAQLGKLAVIENCLGLAAGMGVQLWPVLQDLTQLQELYPKRWESFLGCAGVQMFFTPRECTTSEYVSKLCGETTIKVQSESKGETAKPGLFLNEKTGISSGTSINLQARRERAEDKLRQMAGDRFMMFWDRFPGLFVEAYRKPYWTIPECHGPDGRPLYSPDPYHKPKRTPTAAAA